ncbi:MAG TPA: DUF481 domain-containing protein [Pseudomonadota bacterium]|jgi:putative salt-induced outer membrane protein YdiY|nr:DUF481 domain-containing protein [Deltaproteobacteria bacterium]HPH27628.1 DUF481 domain-containing protein [Pseudomonadota bacterium]
MKRILFGSLTLVGGLFATTTSVEAQALPSGQQFNTEYKFVAPPKEVKEVEWKASASAGFTLAAGNANVMTLSGSANASRNDGKNLIALDLTGLYALTTLPRLLDRDSMGATCMMGAMTGGCNGVVDRAEEIGSDSKVTAGFFLFKGRYDRFFTTNNAGYLAAFVGLDIPASKKAIAGGQLGYSRQMFKTKLHELKAELGVDTTYNSYILTDGSTGADSVFLASARLFVGYNLILGENTQFSAKAESLINLNTATIVERIAKPADATRVNASVALTTKVWQRLSFRFGFNLRYDNCPAPNPNLTFAAYSSGVFSPAAGGAAASGLLTSTSCSSQEHAIEDGTNGATAQDLAIYRVKYNQKLDALTEANLVFNFL